MQNTTNTELRSNTIRLKIRLKVETSSLPVLNINSNTNANFVSRKMISETKLVCAGSKFGYGYLQNVSKQYQTNDHYGLLGKLKI